MQEDLHALTQWVRRQLNDYDLTLQPLAGDASFRSYFRVKQGDKSSIVMYAPPAKERTHEFVTIARSWYAQGILVPQVMAYEPQQGFVLLSDFGDRLLLNALNQQTAEFYYPKAMQDILSIQQSSQALPPFDESHTRRELSLFQEWFCEKLLGLTLSHGQKNLLSEVNALLVHQVLNQPQVPIHRDYHSRNLMILNKQEKLGIIDFQDAMIGPITYDLVSLLKDCYIRFSTQQIQEWVRWFFDRISKQNPQTPKSFELFLQWFDGVGLQRHMKVLGIFSRLNIRDHKANYLKDMPRIMSYVLDVTAHYPEFANFHHFLQQDVLGPLQAFWQQQQIDQQVQVA